MDRSEWLKEIRRKIEERYDTMFGQPDPPDEFRLFLSFTCNL